jgi:hypothetical protein
MDIRTDMQKAFIRSLARIVLRRTADGKTLAVERVD